MSVKTKCSSHSQQKHSTLLYTEWGTKYSYSCDTLQSGTQPVTLALEIPKYMQEIQGDSKRWTQFRTYIFPEL